MVTLSNEVFDFFKKQNFVIVSTLDPEGCIHNSCKGIVKIDPAGKVYLLDLYQKQALVNLKRQNCISITAVDEHKFIGYSLKGRAIIIPRAEFTPDIIQSWDEKIISRITQRVSKNVRGEAGHSHHPEAALPNPQNMIVMDVEMIIDLTPAHIKQMEK